MTSFTEIKTDLFVDGEIRTADDTLTVIDPADGETVVGYAAAASAQQASPAPGCSSPRP